MNSHPKKVLNLYAGIGGNRKLWGGANEVDVTAIELNPEIAKIYQDFFPDDKVIVADAHQYLLDHYNEYEFVWSSPICKTHSNTNRFLNAQGVIRYPDMNLYQEIILLKEFFKGKYVVENVIPYYEPLIPGQISGRHMFWCNFIISDIGKDKTITITNSRASTRRTKQEHLKALQEYHGIKCDNIEYLSNCVNPELGLHIFNMAFKHKQSTLFSGEPPGAPE
jgi:DNA (cytosine-5)-methyltransferase 1